VVRKYASKGAEDLIAMKSVIIYQPIWGKDPEIKYRFTETFFIQCKNLKVEKPLSQKEKKALTKLAKQTGGKAIHVYNNSRHKLVFEELN
jgi:hypothetical protein